MSLFGNRLAAELDAEFVRLANEWYLPWHELARGGTIDVDDFRGGRIQLQSTHFDGAAEHAYWAAIRRHALNKTDEVFRRADREIRALGGLQADGIAEDTSMALRAFLEKLYRHAVFTAYRLQERGYPDEHHLATRRDEAVLAEIQQRKARLLDKYHALPWLHRIALAAGSTRTRWLIFLVFFASMATGGVSAVFRYAG